MNDVSGLEELGDEFSGGDVGNAPGMLDAGLAKYASFDSGLFWRRMGLRWGVIGPDMVDGSLGGGTGGRGAGAGAGMDVPDVRESVDGGSGGSVYDADDARRPLVEVLEDAPTDGRCSSRDFAMLTTDCSLLLGFRKRLYVIVQ